MRFEDHLVRTHTATRRRKEIQHLIWSCSPDLECTDDLPPILHDNFNSATDRQKLYEIYFQEQIKSILYTTAKNTGVTETLLSRHVYTRFVRIHGYVRLYSSC
jgi:hypothetical protein